MAVDLRAIFAYWESIGVFDVVLPFFLVFAIAYSIFSTTKILKDNKINGLISAIIGVLFVQNTYLVGLLQSFIPNVAMLVIVILMFFLIAGTFLGPKQDSTTFAVVGIASIIFVVWALSSSYGAPYYGYGLGSYFDDQTIATLVLVAIFVGVIWFVTKPTGATTLGPKIEKFFKDLWGK